MKVILYMHGATTFTIYPLPVLAKLNPTPSRYSAWTMIQRLLVWVRCVPENFLPAKVACKQMTLQLETPNQNDWSVTNKIEYTGNY